MTYALYAAQWHLSPATTTAIFAIYPVVVVAVLIGAGDLSDHIGRRAAMLYGLTASLAGVLIFAAAPTITWIFAGRILMGVGVGLSAGPATAAMTEYGSPGQAARANAVTTFAQALGLASATLLGGGLIEFAPWPTRLNFVVLAAIIALILTAAWFLPRHTAVEDRSPWRPRTPAIPPGLRPLFWVAATAVVTSYVLGALFLSLGAQIAHDLIRSSHAVINGAAIAFFAIVWAVAALAARRRPPAQAMAGGGAATMASMAFLALATSHASLPLFLAAAASAGIGYALLFLGGLSLLNAHAPAHHRGSTFSALYLAAYLMQGVVSFLLGLAATAWGLHPAIDLGAAAIAISGAAAMLLTLRLTPLQGVPG